MNRYRQLQQWPSFNGTSVTSYERVDGMRYAVVSDTPVAPRKMCSHETSRIVYRVFDDGAYLLGVFVRSSQRGAHMGEKLMQYFIDNVASLEGSFQGTGVIRKPLIALSLARVGLTPLHESFLAEILPQPKGKEREIPQIHILCNELPDERIINTSASGNFYDVVSTEEVARVYPLTGPESVVALHARYVPDMVSRHASK